MLDDDVLGDIVEGYREEVLPLRGRPSAQIWLVRQLASWMLWKARRSMKKILPVRKVLGAFRVSLAWQPLWWTVWGTFAVVIQILQPDSLDPGEILALIRVMGLIGVVSGAVFAALLASVESGKIVGRVSLYRAAMWGIPSAAAVPLLAGKYDQVIPLCPVAMAIAVTLVFIARRGAVRASTTSSGFPDAIFTWVSLSLQETTTPRAEKPS
jgi:hypothetical protein